MGRSQWPHGLRRRSAAACLLRLYEYVRILPVAWRSLFCECCVLSGRVLCVGLITRPEDSYRLWCVVVCDLENLMNEDSLAHWGAAAPKTTNFGWEGEWCSGHVLRKWREGSIPAPEQNWGPAMFQDVSRRRLSPEAPFQPRAFLYGICGGYTETGICFPRLASGFICWYYSTNVVSSYFIHLLPTIYNPSNGQHG
jgi:hypothetical protein